VNSLDSSPQAAWHLELLGGVRLVGPEGPLRVERRTAGLLAYVALEGPTTRSRLAGLLWPESPESTARSNLRQLLRRLRATAGATLVDGTEQLALTEGLVVDAARLREHLRAGELAAAARFRGRLLDGVNFDDLEQLSEWLRGARGALDGLRLKATLAEAGRLQEAGELAAALECARGALEVEPLSEEAHRMLMRLHYLAGDRGAALAAYERCRAMLRAELGVEPLPETVALAREMTRASRPQPQAPRPIPMSVLRPPVLAGREREWALLEAAWAAGQGIMVCGEPGVGKTRLMQDFLASKGRPLYYSGRPGDRTVPYGTHSRTYRELLEVLERDGARPPAWVLREMARLIPGLGEPPGPMRDEEDRLRLYQAKIELHRMAIQLGYNVLGFDDVQYVDDASARAGNYILPNLLGDPRLSLRTVHCYRKGELAPEVEAIIHQAAAAGMLFLLELRPLDSEGVEGMLSSLGLPQLEGLGEQVARYTAGNPLFVLETVKHLLETDELKQGLPENLPPPGKVGPIIASRLQRLSAPALLLARVLGVLRGDFSLELASVVLGAGLAELLAQWTELETAQVVRGSGFSHDLVGETVVATTPPPVKALLHRKAAEALEARRAPAARVAEHWLQAGEPGRAAPALLRAAEDSRTSLLQEAADFYARAAVAFQAQGDERGAQEALLARRQALGG
jgi:DNA-binding SARP family transcriptional activator